MIFEKYLHKKSLDEFVSENDRFFFGFLNFSIEYNHYITFFCHFPGNILTIFFFIASKMPVIYFFTLFAVFIIKKAL